MNHLGCFGFQLKLASTKKEMDWPKYLDVRSRGRHRGWLPCDSGLCLPPCVVHAPERASRLQSQQTSHEHTPPPRKEAASSCTSILGMRRLVPEALSKPALDVPGYNSTIPLAR